MAGDGIATRATFAATNASASTQTSTRALRERAMRRRVNGKLVQSGFTASMVRIGRCVRKAIEPLNRSLRPLDE
jgi:hypothetical protein